MPTRRIARVLIDSPLPQLDRLFDYEIPEELESEAVPGVRIRVPLRTAGRIVDAYLVQIDEPDQADRPLSTIESVISPVPVLTPTLYTLARRAADRAAGSASDILRLALPKRMVRAEKAWLAAPPPSAPVVDQRAQEWTQQSLSGFPDLAAKIDGAGRCTVDAPPHTLRLDKDTEVGAWADLLAAAAVQVLIRGRSSVIVVPDYRDLAQLQAVFDAHDLSGAIVRVDARQSGPERYAALLRTLADVPCIVIGNRSAVYAPVPDLGLIAMWDDGDALMGEPLSPGVHTRDAALLRQELEDCALLFAGHTRSTDVERLIAVGWVTEVSSARRESPRIVLSATLQGEARGARIPSAAFAAARAGLERGPVLVQVARPGYAPVLVCGDCRTSARCVHCAGPLRARSARAAPECQWCGRSAGGWACPRCQSARLLMASAGSERTADELGRAFPGIRIVVADGEHPVAQVDARPALVVATRGAEPLAVGGYQGVLLLDADRMLLADDLRIGESCLRWWSNAAALAAPGAPVHLVGVTGPVARALATWTQPAYARAELADRAPLHMPPAVRVAAVEGTPAAVGAAMHDLRTSLPNLSAEAILGPIPITTEGAATSRSFVRFDYGQGAAITESLRASVISAAMRNRKSVKGRPSGPRNTLRVRVDVPDLDL